MSYLSLPTRLSFLDSGFQVVRNLLFTKFEGILTFKNATYSIFDRNLFFKNSINQTLFFKRTFLFPVMQKAWSISL